VKQTKAAYFLVEFSNQEAVSFFVLRKPSYNVFSFKPLRIRNTLLIQFERRWKVRIAWIFDSPNYDRTKVPASDFV